MIKLLVNQSSPKNFELIYPSKQRKACFKEFSGLIGSRFSCKVLSAKRPNHRADPFNAIDSYLDPSVKKNLVPTEATLEALKAFNVFLDRYTSALANRLSQHKDTQSQLKGFQTRDEHQRFLFPNDFKDLKKFYYHLNPKLLAVTSWTRMEYALALNAFTHMIQSAPKPLAEKLGPIFSQPFQPQLDTQWLSKKQLPFIIDALVRADALQPETSLENKFLKAMQEHFDELHRAETFLQSKGKLLIHAGYQHHLEEEILVTLGDKVAVIQLNTQNKVAAFKAKRVIAPTLWTINTGFVPSYLMALCLQVGRPKAEAKTIRQALIKNGCLKKEAELSFYSRRPQVGNSCAIQSGLWAMQLLIGLSEEDQDIYSGLSNY